MLELSQKKGVKQYPPRNILAGVHGNERVRWWSNGEMVGEMEELGSPTLWYLLQFEHCEASDRVMQLN